MVSADYDVDRAQFFKKEAFQAFQLMDDRTPDYYISYNPFKNGHDDKELDLFGSFFVLLVISPTFVKISLYSMMAMTKT